MTEKEKMLAGQLYDPTDDEIIPLSEQAVWLRRTFLPT
jgi:hypothetical protein